ncbi:MAG: TGS domain-containing protein, partial [Bacillota bacterium]
MVVITLPDGSKKEFEGQVSCYDVARSISNSLAKNAVAAKINGEVVELKSVIAEDSDFAVLTFDDEEGKKVFWHSTSHLMAQAVLRLFPGTKFGIGPAIKDGFYYDFDSEHKFVPEDLP